MGAIVMRTPGMLRCVGHLRRRCLETLRPSTVREPERSSALTILRVWIPMLRGRRCLAPEQRAETVHLPQSRTNAGIIFFVAAVGACRELMYALLC